MVRSYTLLTLVIFLLVKQLSAGAFGDGSFTPQAEVVDGIQIISELKKNGSTYRFYKKDKIGHFSVKRDGEEKDEELCSFSQGITPSLGDRDNNYVIVDVLESGGKITFLVADAGAYALFTLTDVKKVPDDHFIFGLIGMVNEKWVLSAMVYSTAFSPIPGWGHDDVYEYAKLVGHEELRVKEKAKEKADVYKILSDEIHKNGAKAENTGSPRLGIKSQEELLAFHKWVIVENGLTDNEIVSEFKRHYGGKDRFFEILTKMNDQTKATELKARVSAAYKKK